MTLAQIRTTLAEHGFPEGRMISYSKTGYCRNNQGHFVVFNARVFTAHGRVLRQVDLDLTQDGEKLNEAARVIGENLYILYERDPFPYRKPGDKPPSAVLREAIWWTRCRPCDHDRFLPLSSGPLFKQARRLRCITGFWQDQPAFSVELWTNYELESLRNYAGAAIQLVGRPPKPFQVAEKGGELEVQTSSTRGRAVHPVFYQVSGRLAYVWFDYGAAIPAVLFDPMLRGIDGLSFTVHRDNPGIHLRREGMLIGLIWPCGISAPEVLQNARLQLARLRSQDGADACSNLHRGMRGKHSRS